jgi:hypothetical protein
MKYIFVSAPINFPFPPSIVEFSDVSLIIDGYSEVTGLIFNLYRIYSYDRRTLVKAGIIDLGIIKLNLNN